MPSAKADVSAVRRRLEDVQARLQDPSPAWTAVADEIQLAVEERFAAGTDFDGNSWPTLKAATTKRHGSHGTLNSTGTLRSSNFFRPHRHGVEVGNSAPYAAPIYYGSADGTRQPRWWFQWRPDGTHAIADGTPGGDLLEEIRAVIAHYVLEGRTR